MLTYITVKSIPYKLQILIKTQAVRTCKYKMRAIEENFLFLKCTCRPETDSQYLRDDLVRGENVIFSSQILNPKPELTIMKPNLIFDYPVFKSHVLSLIPPQPIQYAVTKEQQQKEISSLKETIGSRRFFFVTNLENYEIEEACGIERWLGYSERDFTMKKYLNILHPGRRKAVQMIALHLYNTLCIGKFSLNFMVQRYSSLIALKHSRGHYLLANKISSVFQYDINNRLTACLHEYTIISDEYNGEALGPQFFTSNGEGDDRGIEILQNAIEHFLKLKVFSPKELQVARKIAYEPKIKQKQVADILEIPVDDLHQYYSRFLRKARDFFHHEFENTVDAALYLKKEGLI